LIGKTATAGKSGNRTQTENAMMGAINQNKPVIVRVDKGGSHYFVVCGYYITTEGSVTIYIRDPEGDYGRTTLSDYYRDSSILSFVIIG